MPDRFTNAGGQGWAKSQEDHHQPRSSFLFIYESLASDKKNVGLSKLILVKQSLFWSLYDITVSQEIPLYRYCNFRPSSKVSRETTSNIP